MLDAHTRTLSQLINTINRPLSKIDPEIYVIVFFTAASLFIGPNKLYLLALIACLGGIYLINSSMLQTLWLSYLGIALFQKGRIFPITVIPASLWSGNYDLTYNQVFLFSDLVLLGIIYYVLTRARSLITSSPSPPYQRIWGYIMLFMITGGISVWLSPFPHTAFYHLLQFIKYVALFHVGSFIFSIPGLLRKSAHLIVGLIVADAMLLIGQWLHGGPFGLLIEDLSLIYGDFADENPGLYRPGGIYSDPNIAGLLLALFLPVILIIYRKSSVLAGVIFGICIVALIATGSRASWIVAIPSIYLLLKTFHVHTVLQSWCRHLITRGMVIFGIVILMTPVAHRLWTLRTAFSIDGGGLYRINHIRVGLHYLMQNPFGHGIGTFPYLMARDFPPPRSRLMPAYSHNVIAELVAETGIIGTLLMILIPCSILVGTFQAYKRTKSIHIYVYLISYSSFILLMQFFPWFINPKTAPWFWLLSGLGGYFINDTYISTTNSH